MAQGMIDMVIPKNECLDHVVSRTPEGTNPTTFRQGCEKELRPAVLGEICDVFHAKRLVRRVVVIQATRCSEALSGWCRALLVTCEVFENRAAQVMLRRPSEHVLPLHYP